MKNLMILAAVLILSGCGLTYDCERETRSVSTNAALTMLEGRDVTLTLQDGTTYEGRVAKVSEDTLELRQEGKGNPYYVPPIQIRTATVHKSGVGPALLGGFFGTMSGTPDGRIEIVFNPTAPGTSVVMEQKGLIMSFNEPIEIINTIDGSQPGGQGSRGSAGSTRGGVHR